MAENPQRISPNSRDKASSVVYRSLSTAYTLASVYSPSLSAPGSSSERLYSIVAGLEGQNADLAADAWRSGTSGWIRTIDRLTGVDLPRPRVWTTQPLQEAVATEADDKC